MFKHKHNKTIVIGFKTYEPDEEGFLYLPYKYKKYNPVEEVIKTPKKKKKTEE